MKLFVVAIALPESEEFWFGLYFVIVSSEEEAKQTGITYFISTHPDLVVEKDFVVEVVEVPVDEDMLPRIAQNMKARKFLEGVVQ